MSKSNVFNRIGALLITIMLIVSLSVGGYASGFVPDGDEADSGKVQITSVNVTYKDNDDPYEDGDYFITVNYEVEGSTENTQVAMLAYVFDGRLNDINGTTAEAFDASKHGSGYTTFIQGAVRAIEQQNYSGTMSFSLLKASKNGSVNDYAVTPNDYLLVKICTDNTNVSSQAFFIRLANAKDEDAPDVPETYTVTYKAGGGIGKDVTQTYVKGDSIILPECMFAPHNQKIFDKWQIGNTTYNPGDTYVISDNITVTAVWKEIPNAPSGGGSGGGGNADETLHGIYGDVFVDGFVDDFDWMTILNHLTGEIPCNELDDEKSALFKAGDVFQDGFIDDFDWMTILNHLTGEIPSNLLETEF